MRSKKLKGGNINVFSKKKNLKKVIKKISKKKTVLLELVDIFKYFISKNKSPNTLRKLLSKLKKNKNLYNLLLSNDNFFSNLTLQFMKKENTNNIRLICVSDNYSKNFNINNVKIKYLDICALILSLEREIKDKQIFKKIVLDEYEDIIDDDSKIYDNDKTNYFMIISQIVNYLNDIIINNLSESNTVIKNTSKMTKPFNVVNNFEENSALASVLMTLLLEPNKYIINLINTPWNNLNSTAPLLKVFRENIFKQTLYDFKFIENNYGVSQSPQQYLDKIFTTNDCIVVEVETVLNKSLEGIPSFSNLKQLEYLQINLVKKNIICKIDPKNLKNNVSVQTLLNSYTSIDSGTRNLNVTYNVIYNSNYLILDIQRIKDYIINSSMIHLNYEIKLKSGKLLYLSGIISHDFIENIYESFILYKGRWYHVNNSTIYTEIGDYKDLLKYNNQQVKSSCVLLFYKDTLNRNNVNNASVESNNVIKNKFNYLKKTRFDYGWR